MHHIFEYEPYVSQIEGLYPMPRIMAQLSAKLKNSETSIDDIAELILTDTTLVGSIMRISDSSYFHFDEKSSSLVEAIQRIGLHEISKMVSIGVSKEAYQHELVHYRIPPEVFWESSISAALLMESLFNAMDRPGDEAYLAGLMREIGMLVIDHFLSSNDYAENWDGYASIEKWEVETCGVNHADTGARLLEKWTFPESVCDAVHKQWNVPDRSSPLRTCLQLVNRIIFQTSSNLSLPIRDIEPLAPFLDLLGLSNDVLTEVFDYSVSKFLRLHSLAL